MGGEWRRNAGGLSRFHHSKLGRTVLFFISVKCLSLGSGISVSKDRYGEGVQPEKPQTVKIIT